MDKILLTAFLSALAGFITATLSIVKLVNEKESKTTEYRQAWTDSLRKSFAELIGLINAQAGNLESARTQRSTLIRLLRKECKEGEKDLTERAVDHAESTLRERQAQASEMRREIYKIYALTRLHFKPDDLSFSRVEQHFNLIISLFKEMEKEDETKLAAIREKIHATADEITAFSRNILKTEWETVKKGEAAYQLTKKWSIAGSVLMLFILISIGAHAAFSIWKESIKKDATIDRVKISAASTIPAPQSIAVPSSIRTIDDSLPAGIHISSMATCEHVSSPTQTRKTNTGSTHANSGAKTCPNS